MYFKKLIIAIWMLCCIPIPLIADIYVWKTPAGTEHRMVLIEAGDFEMGTGELDIPGSDVASPMHSVYLDAFYSDLLEVTVEQFEAFIKNVDYNHDGSVNANEKGFVRGVNWFEARDYCIWAGLRLHTEAEWEKAARWAWSFVSERNRREHQHSPFHWQDFPYGEHHMDGGPTGGQWVQDWYRSSYYRFSPSENPQGPIAGTEKVARGAHWDSEYDNIYFPSLWTRSRGNPSRRYDGTTFRCARSVDDNTAITPDTWGQIKERVPTSQPSVPTE